MTTNFTLYIQPKYTGLKEKQTAWANGDALRRIKILGGERKKVLYTHSKLGKITVAWDRRGRELGRLFSCRRNGVFGLTARFGSEGGNHDRGLANFKGTN